MSRISPFACACALLPPLPAPLLHLKMLRRASATAIAAIVGDAERDARKAIAELINRRRCAPALLRLAFHDAATFDAESRTGGSNASIRCGERHGKNDEKKKKNDARAIY